MIFFIGGVAVIARVIDGVVASFTKTEIPNMSLFAVAWTGRVHSGNARCASALL